MSARTTRLGYPQRGLGAPLGPDSRPRSVGAPRKVGPAVDNPCRVLPCVRAEGRRGERMHPAAILGRVLFARTRHLPRGGRGGEGGAEAVIEITVRARANGRAIGSGCKRRAQGYAVLGEGPFEYVPLWGI